MDFLENFNVREIQEKEILYDRLESQADETLQYKDLTTKQLHPSEYLYSV